MLAPLGMSSGWINIAILTLLFIYLCVAWNVVGGIAGQFCIDHDLFWRREPTTRRRCSRRISAIRHGLGCSPALLATMIGIFIAWLSFRYELPPLSFALVTIALAMLGYLAISSIDVLGASRGLTLPVRGTRRDVSVQVGCHLLCGDPAARRRRGGAFDVALPH